jgi:hypothetical protein
MIRNSEECTAAFWITFRTDTNDDIVGYMTSTLLITFLFASYHRTGTRIRAGYNYLNCAAQAYFGATGECKTTRLTHQSKQTRAEQDLSAPFSRHV